MSEKTFSPFISESKIQETVKSLGAQITKDYQGKNLLVIGVLRGSAIFMADLVRHIKLPLEMDFVRISSYGHGTVSSGEIKLMVDISAELKDRHVLVVEDILDTGQTLNFFKSHLQKQGPASVKLCTFLDKPSRRKVPIQADYSGITIDDIFVVGYGLDYQEKYRNSPDILALKE